MQLLDFEGPRPSHKPNRIKEIVEVGEALLKTNKALTQMTNTH